MEKKLVSIIIPCYNEEEALDIVYDAIVETMRPLDNYRYEILLINDGSKDGTLKKMKALAQANTCVNIFHFHEILEKKLLFMQALAMQRVTM